MNEDIASLKTILRLRERDLERCERAAAAARKEVMEAERCESAAASACNRATAACEQAMATQLRTPGDPLVQLHCKAVAARVDSARACLGQARTALQEACALADNVRHEWLRARARRDAIASQLERAVQQWRRHLNRKAEEDQPPFCRPAAA